MSEKKEKVKKGNGNGNLIKLAILIVLVLILVGGAAYGGYYFAAKTGKIQFTVKQEAVQETPSEETKVVLEEFLLNLADTDTTHVVKTKIALAYDAKNKKVPKEVESKKVEIRDAIISVMSSKKSADFTPKGREDIKKEILIRVNSLFTTGKLTNIYYNDIFVQ